jgi:predicted ATP-grasp superfamily ATP-dependent carboligase
VFCSSENVIVRLNEERAKIEAKTRLMSPPTECFELAISKEKTLALAEQVGMPIPRTLLVSTISDALRRLKELSFPIVAKFPKGAVPQAGPAFDFKAKHFPSAQEFERWSGRLDRDLPTPLLLQEFIPGRGVGVEVLIRDGKVRAIFQHARIREYPASGGGSCYCKSVPLDPVLAGHALRLLSAMQWDGVAMVEFRQNPETGAFALMEVNGRFWGSLPLALNAGANFPLLWYKSSTGTSNDGAPAQGRIGVRCRAMAGDTLWLLEALREPGNNRMLAIRDYLGAFLHSTTYFTWRWDDPWPAIWKALSRIRLRS